jgi:Ankyrin repeats (many copies)
MVELLVASGVPANALTIGGLTALHLAEAKQDEEMIEVLV